jgi:hypothetical protein
MPLTKKAFRPKTTPLSKQEKQRDALIQRLLVELARLLLPGGVTPNYLNLLIKRSFVQAAAANSRFRNGRINYSRVAVLTGLTRSEVRRVLTPSSDEVQKEPVLQSRADRVLHGWLTDAQFLSRGSVPKPLPIRGRTSFAALVRKYGGDVPHRAVLDELLKIRAVKRVRDRVEMNRMPANRRSGSSSALALAASVIADAARVASRAQVSDVQPPIYRLELIARNNVELLVLKRRVSEAIASVFEGLRGSLQYRPVRRKRIPRGRSVLTVTALIAEQDAHNESPS